jgi:hypothetical protein
VIVSLLTTAFASLHFMQVDEPGCCPPTAASAPSVTVARDQLPISCLLDVDPVTVLLLSSLSRSSSALPHAVEDMPWFCCTSCGVGTE